MKKCIKRLITLILVSGFIIFVGCQTNIRLNKPSQLTKIKLVPKDFAEIIAENFNPAIFFGKIDSARSYLRVSSTTLSRNNQITSSVTFKGPKNNPVFYVFNFTDSAGFVFVSADFNIRPILAYIPHGKFQRTNRVPGGFTDWLNKTIENVEIVRKGIYDNTRAAQIAWNDYIKEYTVKTSPSGYLLPPPPTPPPPSCDNVPPSETSTVGPLLPTTWGQLCSYNNLCDLAHNYSCNFFPCDDSRPATGCVATAMAQIIRYYQYPSQYNYASMPNASGNIEVQKLMRDVGESVNMNYGCESGAYGSAVPGALKNTFNYSSANRWSYSFTNTDYEHIYNNICISSEPVILEGSDDNAGAHMWVCDGVRTRKDYICMFGKLYIETFMYFHMNWGWHETWVGNDFNGWYGFSDWNIPGAGPGGSDLNFQYYDYAITEIHP